MKTSVVLDSKKVQKAKELGGASTLRELLDKALDSYISQQRRLGMADMLGTDFFEGDLKTGRKTRGGPRR